MEEHNESTKRIEHLQKLLDDAKKLNDVVDQQSVEKSLDTITGIVYSANQLMDERAFNKNEAVVDSILFRQCNELTSKVLKKIDSFDVTELANAIRKIVYKDNEYNWNNLAPYVFNLSKTVYTSVPMLAHADVKPKVSEPRKRQKRRRAELGEIQRPSTTSQLQPKENGGDEVNHVHKQLKEIFRANGHKPVPYYRLIIDPGDFNNTVQNAIQICNLIHENILGMDKGPDGRPQVRFVSSAELKAAAAAGGTGEEAAGGTGGEAAGGTGEETADGTAGQAADGTGGQAICSLDFGVCQRMIELYNIKEPMIVWGNEEENKDGDCNKINEKENDDDEDGD